MSRPTVDIDIFDPSSIDAAIEQLEVLQEKLDRLNARLERLAQLGVKVAEDAFAMVALDTSNDPVTVTYRMEKEGFTIYARGRQVAYMEFGAGVYYNGEEPYEGERPAGIDPIGGHDTITGSSVSLGIFDTWAYKDGNRTVVTHGTPACQGMYLAQEAMAREAKQIIKEIFR